MREPQPTYPPNLRAALDAMRKERPDLFGHSGGNETIQDPLYGGTSISTEHLLQNPELAQQVLSSIPHFQPPPADTQQQWVPFDDPSDPAAMGRDGSLQTLLSGSQGQTPQDLMRALLPQLGEGPDLSYEGLLAGGLMPGSEQEKQAAIEYKTREEAGTPNPADTFAAEKKPRKKKSNKSEFFALLRRIDAEEKDGKKDTRKALKQLAKQLSDSDSVATKGNATGTAAV